MIDEDGKLEYTVESRIVGIAELQALARESWARMKIEGTSENALAKQSGIDVAALPDGLDQLLSMKTSGAGLDLNSVMLVIAGAAGSALTVMAKDIWKKVLLPRIVQRWGPKAIKEQSRAKGNVGKA